MTQVAVDPEYARPAVVPRPQRDLPAAGGRERILIVDDNDLNRRLLAAILKRAGYATLQASGGIEGRELAERERPDLILLDVMMPVRDGYEICADLKANPTTADIPVVFLSALSEAADKIHGLQVGAVDFVSKPFNEGEVLARVRSHLHIRQLTQEVMTANLALLERQRRLDEDLRAAAGIQRSLMPRNPDLPPRVALSWRFRPCDQIGGDVFNVHRLNERYWAIYILDVSGHGVPAAMVTVAVSQSLTPDAGIIRRPGTPDGYAAPVDVLHVLDTEYPIERFEKYFTIWYGVLDAHTGRLRYTQAGHPMPLLLRADGGVERLSAGGSLIGFGMPFAADEGEVVLEPGDRLYLYTDGIVEFEDCGEEHFGEARLLDVLGRCRSRALDESCGEVLNALEAFGGATHLQDDVTLVAFEWHT